MTKNELKELIRETVREVIREMASDLTEEILTPRLDALAARLEGRMEDLFFELEQQLPDPDEGLEFSPEFAEQLRASIKDKNKGKLYSHEDVKRRLGIED